MEPESYEINIRLTVAAEEGVSRADILSDVSHLALRLHEPRPGRVSGQPAWWAASATVGYAEPAGHGGAEASQDYSQPSHLDLTGTQLRHHLDRVHDTLFLASEDPQRLINFHRGAHPRTGLAADLIARHAIGGVSRDPDGSAEFRCSPVTSWEKAGEARDGEPYYKVTFASGLSLLTHPDADLDYARRHPMLLQSGDVIVSITQAGLIMDIMPCPFDDYDPGTPTGEAAQDVDGKGGAAECAEEDGTDAR